MDFTIRIYNPDNYDTCLMDIQNITISGITIISKPSKFGGICRHKGNMKKFKYSFETSKSFHKTSGSHSSPVLSFSGKYIDIKIKNFPRYPVFGQDKYVARNCLNGYSSGRLNNGFPDYLLYRDVEIIKQVQQSIPNNYGIRNKII